MPKAPSASRAATLARFWCVHLRTAQKWLAAPAGAAASATTPPVAALDDPARMLAWFRGLPSASQSKFTRPFRARLDAFRIALERGDILPTPTTPAPSSPASASPHALHGHAHPLPSPPPGAPLSPSLHPHPPPPSSSPISDPDWTAFLSTPHGARLHAAAATGATLDTLRLRYAYADHKLGLAQQRGDHPSVREWTDTAGRLAGIIHDEETRAARLGRDLGDLLPRTDAERLARALGYWLLQSADHLRRTLTPALSAAAAAGPLAPADFDRHLDPALLRALILEPLARAATVNAGTTLPPWFIAALRESTAATLEDGAALFDTLYQATIPRVTTPPPAPAPSAAPAAPVSTSQTRPPADPTPNDLKETQ